MFRRLGEGAPEICVVVVCVRNQFINPAAPIPVDADAPMQDEPMEPVAPPPLVNDDSKVSDEEERNDKQYVAWWPGFHKYRQAKSGDRLS